MLHSVRPILEFASVTWSPFEKCDIKKVFSCSNLQNMTDNNYRNLTSLSLVVFNMCHIVFLCLIGLYVLCVLLYLDASVVLLPVTLCITSVLKLLCFDLLCLDLLCFALFCFAVLCIHCLVFCQVEIPGTVLLFPWTASYVSLLCMFLIVFKRFLPLYFLITILPSPNVTFNSANRVLKFH